MQAMPEQVRDDPVSYAEEPPPRAPPGPEDFNENVFDKLKNVRVPVYEKSEHFRTPPTLGEVILVVLDIATKNKQTDGVMEDAWAMLRLMLPGDENMESFNKVAVLLEAHIKGTLEIIHSCVNDCIGYFNCKSPELKHYMHAHRTFCPKCGQTRYLEGTKVPRKVFYYLPMGYAIIHFWFTIGSILVHFWFTFGSLSVHFCAGRISKTCSYGPEQRNGSTMTSRTLSFQRATYGGHTGTRRRLPTIPK